MGVGRTAIIEAVWVAAIAALALFLVPAGAEAATADAVKTQRQRYAITITATSSRWEQSRLPDGTTTGTWLHISRWTARGTSVVKRAGARVNFNARIGGLLTRHEGIGNGVIRIGSCEGRWQSVDLKPATRGAFSGNLQYYAFRRRLASGRRIDVVRLLFTRRAPIVDPPLDEAFSATACSPAYVSPGRTTLAVPPSWVVRRPLAGKRALPTFRFGRAFTWKGVHPDWMPIHVDVPGGWQKTNTRWTITFKPIHKR